MGKYDTKLSPEDEVKFTQWRNKLPKDQRSDEHYDLRGYWKDSDPDKTMEDAEHSYEKYKKPSHPTFSNESIYATGDDAIYAGAWSGEGGDEFTMNPDTIRERAIRDVLPFIRTAEAYKRKAYRPKTRDKTGKVVYGNWTVGYGFEEINGRKVKEGDEISPKDAEKYLRQIVRRNAEYLDKKEWVRELKQPGTLAGMYDVMYQTGKHRFDRGNSPRLNEFMDHRHDNPQVDLDHYMWDIQLPSYRKMYKTRNDNLRKAYRPSFLDNLPALEVSETFDTPIPDNLRPAFDGWYKSLPDDKKSMYDYDLQGAWLEHLGQPKKYEPESPNGHMDDYGKKPNHPTFSSGSKWHDPLRPTRTGGEWKRADDGSWDFYPGSGNRLSDDELQDYFSRNEGGNRVHRRDVRQAAGGGDTAGGTEEVPPEAPIAPGRGTDGPRVVINPSTFKNKKDALCVAFNERFRIWMEQNDWVPQSEPTAAQRKFFSDTAYADDEDMLRRTIIARIATLDTSVKDPTDEQFQDTLEMLNGFAETEEPSNEWEANAISRLTQMVERVAAAQPIETPINPKKAAPEDDVRAVAGGGETDEEKPGVTTSGETTPPDSSASPAEAPSETAAPSPAEATPTGTAATPEAAPTETSATPETTTETAATPETATETAATPETATETAATPETATETAATTETEPVAPTQKETPPANQPTATQPASSPSFSYTISTGNSGTSVSFDGVEVSGRKSKAYAGVKVDGRDITRSEYDFLAKRHASGASMSDKQRAIVEAGMGGGGGSAGTTGSAGPGVTITVENGGTKSTGSATTSATDTTGTPGEYAVVTATASEEVRPSGAYRKVNGRWVDKNGRPL